MALLGCTLGLLWGFHFVLLVQLAFVESNNENSFFGTERIQLLRQWCAYIACLSTFHMAEFFVTALYNPTQATADSFLVNHSTAYTAAALTSWTEFWLRFALAPSLNGTILSAIGLVLVLISQTIRSVAMASAGVSFNHIIQTSKKHNHVLVTHGIYRILRHPSYVGFFYWSIATQMLLGNVIHAVLFGAASWSFFRRRIEYEEESLCQFFPETYPVYVSRTYIGIPFLRTRIDTSTVLVKKIK